MMADRRATNRAMFWRIIRRLFGANRGRLFVMLLALGAGAAVTAALLNLQVDAKRRLTTDFLAFGPNAVIVPRDIPGSPHDFATETLDESVLSIAPSKPQGRHFIGFPFLYVASSVSSETSSNPDQAIVAGTYLNLLFWAEPVVKVVPESGPLASGSQCYAGVHIAEKMQLHPGSLVRMASGNQAEKCVVAGVLSSGGPADSQVFVSLDVAQRLAGLPGRLSVIKLRDGGDCVGAYGALRDGGDDQHGDGTEDGCWLDEGGRRFDAPRAAVFPCRSGASRACGRRDRRRAGDHSFDGIGKSRFWRSGAAAAHCVSCSCDADDHRGDLT